MKTIILLILISILLVDCGTRKKNLSKIEVQSSFENKGNLQQSTSGTNKTTSITDIRSFLLTTGLKIKSNGQNYEFKYDEFSFSGSADIELSQKKEETIIHHTYQTHTMYVTETKYQTKTNYRTQKNSKNLNVQRNGVSFGTMIWVILSSLVAGVVLWEFFKRLILK